jgi:hypothetical protein
VERARRIRPPAHRGTRRRPALLLGRCVRRMNAAPDSVRVTDAVLGFLSGPARPGGGDHGSVRHGQQRAARCARLRIVTPRPAHALTARLYRRRGGCGCRFLAGHRAAVACRRIGGTVPHPAAQADLHRQCPIRRLTAPARRPPGCLAARIRTCPAGGYGGSQRREINDHCRA